MARSWEGKEISRSSARVSRAVTTPMCNAVPAMISEKTIRSGAYQLRPAAFCINREGDPPSTGTVQVSQPADAVWAVYPTREPSGVNTGSYLRLGSSVSCLDSPEESNL